MGVWIQFLVCIVLIGVAGVQLTRYGDVIADKTGLGGTWIGLVLVATVTSLPELASGISSVTIADVPDIAVGNVLGACVLNLTILALLDALHRGETLYQRASPGHILPAGFVILLLGITGFGLLTAEVGQDWRLWHVGFYTPLILIGYFVAVRTVYRHEMAQVARFTEAEPDRYPGLSLRTAVLRYSLAAVVVIAAGIWLPFVGEGIARQMGWTESFVGTLFVALVTTVPELVVTLSALRIGAVDMAIGNLLGSSLFNLMILAVDDLFYVAGPLLGAASPAHAVTVFSVTMMTGVVIVSLFYRPRARLLKTMGWGSLVLLAIYALNSAVVYIHG
ncbi:sodium:calcium antiporter [Thioalkalivibrio sulfidiphilus]|uniref:sodium:calcium antiporter n=1 Tax=Thioalkalivibrio sulfidiphilus TaxID=1033854 RepID=UPI0018C99DF8|nr:sodium:calcium antiporter [Thioalkalivibrio sulfidiphilus]